MKPKYLTPDHVELIEGLIFIADKNAEKIPFKLNEVQREYLKHRTSRDIILKARQMGMSSLILAVFLLDCIFHENINAVVISHEEKATQRLFNRVKFYLDSLPKEWKVNLGNSARNELYFSDTNSRFYIGTAGAKAFGHGDTIHRLHVSELSRWENPSLLMGLLQAIPKTENSVVVIESTANGTGNEYYERWMSAKGDDNPFTDHFYPWTMFKEYQTQPGPNFVPTADEQVLMKEAGMTIPQIVWRRSKIEEFVRDERGVDPIDFFKEQYPSNEMEAFVSTSSTAFNLKSLQAYARTDGNGKTAFPQGRKGKIVIGGGGYLDFEPDNTGWLMVWDQPDLTKKYSIGADVASGTKRGDYCAAVVICNDTMEQVAEFRARCDTDVFADELRKLGEFYGKAHLAIETNNQGLAVLKKINELGYKQLYYRQSIEGNSKVSKAGWETTSRTRPLMIDYMAALIRNNEVVIKSELLVRECMSFIKSEKGRYEAASGAHDDLVMACAVALQAYKNKPITGEKLEEKDRRKQEREKRRVKRGDAFSSIRV